MKERERGEFKYFSAPKFSYVTFFFSFHHAQVEVKRVPKENF